MTRQPLRCPLCHGDRQRPSWLGVRRFKGRDYRWIECAGCGSSYYDPVPDDAVLRSVYDAEYLHLNRPADAPGSPKDHQWVLGELRRRRPGVFVDYGCGAGDLMKKAAQIGWDARGVELNADVAAQVARETGLPVTSDPESLKGSTGGPQADVVHAGDVIEHFSHLDRELDWMMALLKPGGLLMAQGPLLSGSCLFNFVYRAAGRARPNRVVEAAPTHLVASTRAGILKLIERRQLKAREFRVSEVAWPGPWRWEPHPKAAALFALRRLSQHVSRWAPRTLGNRYRFVVVKPA